VAVFIEPAGKLRAFLSLWKGRVSRDLGPQPYLNHPPHGTLWCSAVRDTGRWALDVRAAVSRLVPFALRTSGPMVFWDDAPAGGHTLALRAASSGPLRRLQMAVAAASAAHVDGRKAPRLPGPLRREPFESSRRRYGFPFVGEHWIPHFTLASLQTPREHPLIASFLGRRRRHAMTVRRVSLWEVRGDAHRRLSVVLLDGGRRMAASRCRPFDCAQGCGGQERRKKRSRMGTHQEIRKSGKPGRGDSLLIS
jgi:hypothetical protein